LSAFVVMSCDNIPGNGDVARSSLAAFARMRDPALGDRIDSEVRFPNGMVDRITPATTDDDRAEVAHRFSIQDGWPVVCEPFTQWVLEDWDGARPPLDEVGVQLVEDVGPYELMKLRLLNGSHQALCYLGYLAGYRYAHEVCQDPLFAEFLLAYMDAEATPTLEPVPGIDLDAYKPNLIARFSNPQVRDTLARLCMESSDRIPKWLLPVIRENLAKGGQITLTATVVAAWARYSEGVDEQGEPIVVVDRLRDTLVATAQQQGADPLAFVRNRELFGDLVDDERFTTSYLAALDSLHTRGARKTLEHLLHP
jgi:mannitol 2-dehydrogenase